MSWQDYLLPNPFEEIPKAWDETKSSAKDVKGKDKHHSVFSGIGRLTDPLSFLLGKGYTNVVHHKIPEYANRVMEPFVKVGHYGNPLYWYGKRTGNDTLNYVHDFGSAKGADILATVLGGVAAGSALGGGAAAGGTGGGSGGAAAGGGAAGGGSTAAASGGSSGGGLFNFGAMDWTNPNTYMNLAGSMPMGGGQGGQQQQALLAELERRRREEADRARREALMAQLQSVGGLGMAQPAQVNGLGRRLYG